MLIDYQKDLQDKNIFKNNDFKIGLYCQQQSYVHEDVLIRKSYLRYAIRWYELKANAS